MTLRELYEQTDKNDHKNIHVSGDRVFVTTGGSPAKEYLIVPTEKHGEEELIRIR